MAKGTGYVDNEKFFQCIVEYKKKMREAEAAGNPKPRIPEYAGECIKLIAENLSERYYKFARYSYNDEMKGDSILNCIKYFDSFDEKVYSNPHAYFTMVCYRSNQMRIKLEQKNQYVKFKHFDNEMIMSGDANLIFNENHGLLDKELYDNICTYIDNFERKEIERKEKRKEKVNEKKMRDSLDRFMEGEEDNEV